jgi:60 kDa SS-A/Ro ribonucleoprotein
MSGRKPWPPKGYTRHLTQAEVTPQSEPLAGQVPNSAGGYASPVDDWMRAQRFLILGAEGGSYYASEPKLVIANAQAVIRCAQADPHRLAALLHDVSVTGRAPKQDPTLFALAIMTAMGNPARSAALTVLPRICRTAAHLLQWVREHEALTPDKAGAKGAALGAKGHWAYSLRRAVATWFEGRSAEDVAEQVVKYPQRKGWACLDLLRLGHPPGASPEHVSTYRWTRRGAEAGRVYPKAIMGMEALRAAESPLAAAKVLRDYRLPREAVEVANPDWLTARPVWEALLLDADGRVTMPMTALIRTLNRLTAVGVLDDREIERAVCAALVDQARLNRARVHPLAVLVAQRVYASGAGLRGSLTWEPRPTIIDALDEAFVLAHHAVVPAGKRLCVALDVSSSMASGSVAGSPLTPREAAAALASVWLRTEPLVETVAFQNRIVSLPLSAKMRLDDVIARTRNLPFGGTDCAQPMLWAARKQTAFDAFVVVTDSETWAGAIHPTQALRQYRQAVTPEARLVVVGLVSNGFTIADPADAGMLDVVGMDAGMPQVVNAFMRGEV